MEIEVSVSDDDPRPTISVSVCPTNITVPSTVSEEANFSNVASLSNNTTPVIGPQPAAPTRSAPADQGTDEPAQVKRRYGLLAVAYFRLFLGKNGPKKISLACYAHSQGMHPCLISMHPH